MSLIKMNQVIIEFNLNDNIKVNTDKVKQKNKLKMRTPQRLKQTSI